MRRAFFLAAAALPLLLLTSAALAHVFSDELLRRLAVHVLQKKVGRGALRDAPVSLGALSLNSRRADGTWSVELRDLHIGNVPRDGDAEDWKSPYAVHLEALRLAVPSGSALLSVMQIPVASVLGAPSLPRTFAGGLDFVAGFRVKSIDVLEVVGLTVCLEDDVDEAGQQREKREKRGPIPEVVLKRGRLRKDRREFDFVLEPSRLSWYEPGDLDGLINGRGEEGTMGATASSPPSPPKPKPKPIPKPRGSVRLYPSSSVEVFDGEGGADLELVSDTDYLPLRAASVEERDEWVSAFAGAISELAVSTSYRNNIPWLEVLSAESHSRKVRWRRREWRRRRDWKRQWQSDGDGNGEGEGEGNGNGEDETEDEGKEEDEDEAIGDLTGSGDADGEDYAGNEEDGDAGEVANFPAGRRDREGRRVNVREQRLEDVLEWNIGKLEVRGLTLRIGGRHLVLDDDGWSLRGFVGSGKDLKRRLKFGLARKLLKDSSERMLKSGISGYTGKEEYVFGDITKSTANKVGAALFAGVSSYTGKQEYHFGDVTKATANKVGAAVVGFTGKEKYEFGDVTKTTANKVGAAVAAGVSGFTGKEKYEFGDVTKSAVDKVRRILTKD